MRICGLQYWALALLLGSPIGRHLELLVVITTGAKLLALWAQGMMRGAHRTHKRDAAVGRIIFLRIVVGSWWWLWKPSQKDSNAWKAGRVAYISATDMAPQLHLEQLSVSVNVSKTQKLGLAGFNITGRQGMKSYLKKSSMASKMASRAVVTLEEEYNRKSRSIIEKGAVCNISFIASLVSSQLKHPLNAYARSLRALFFYWVDRKPH